MTKVSLVTFTAIPHHSAESIHMVMTAMEMAKICDFELISPAKLWRRQTFSKDLSIYDVDGSSIRHRKIIQLYPNDVFFLNTISKNKDHVVYCRQILVANYFLKKNIKVLLELHLLPTKEEIESLRLIVKHPKFVGLIVITESLRHDILLEIEEDNFKNIFVLPDAADIDRFHFHADTDGSTTLKAGYIGSNFPGKGWEIIEQLPNRTSTEFHIFGFSNENNLFKNIVFYGKIPFANIPEALDSFDIGLLPNQPSVTVAGQVEIGRYTSPMKLFEYMASGKVIIASDLPVIREILTNNYNALLVPHNDPDAWILAINKLNTDRKLFNRLKNQAFSDVVNHYSYKARAKKIVDIIDSYK